MDFCFLLDWNEICRIEWLLYWLVFYTKSAVFNPFNCIQAYLNQFCQNNLSGVCLQYNILKDFLYLISRVYYSFEGAGGFQWLQSRKIYVHTLTVWTALGPLSSFIFSIAFSGVISESRVIKKHAATGFIIKRGKLNCKTEISMCKIIVGTNGWVRFVPLLELIVINCRFWR